MDRLPESIHTARGGADLALPPTPLFLKAKIDRYESDEDSEISPGGILGSILASSIARGSYSEHIMGLGDALSCMENNDNANDSDNRNGNGNGNGNDNTNPVAVIEDEFEDEEEVGRKKTLTRKKKASGKKKAQSASIPASSSDRPGTAPTAGPKKKKETKKKRLKKKAAPAPSQHPPQAPPPPSPPPPPLAEAPQVVHTPVRSPPRQKSTSPPNSDSTSTIINLNKKLSEIQKRYEYEVKLRADAEATAIIAEGNVKNLASENRREKDKAQKAQLQASKAQTSLLAANENLFLSKQQNKEFMGEAEIIKERIRDMTGKAAAAEALLEAERDRNKVAKTQNSELKAAIRKLATLRETGEYTPRMNTAINETSPPPAEPAKDSANAQQLKQLKNENIYLRKQVSSEIQCKKELQNVVESQNERLQGANVTIRNLEGKLKTAESATSTFGTDSNDASEGNKENELLGNKNQHPVEVENESLRRELKGMTDCYHSARQNLTVTQKALENTRAINSKTESEMLIVNSQLEEARVELEGQERHHNEMVSLLQNKVDLADKKIESVENHYEAAREGSGIEAKKKLACFRMLMALMKVTEGSRDPLREFFLSWALSNANKRGEGIKEDAKISAVKEKELARKEIARVKKEEERRASDKVESVKKKATDHVNKIKDEMKRVLTSRDSEIGQLKGVLEAFKGKLKVAGEDRETFKGRIAELQVQAKALDTERGRERREKEETKRQMEEQLVEKQKVCEELERKVQEVRRRMEEREESMKSKNSVEIDKALLELEKSLRAEHGREVGIMEEKWRVEMKEEEKRRFKAEERGRKEVERVIVEQKKVIEETEARWKTVVEELKATEAERRDREVEEGRREAGRMVKDAVEMKEKEVKGIVDLVAKEWEVKMEREKEEAERAWRGKLEDVERERDEEFKRLEDKAELGERMKLGEERARSARAVQRTREEVEEDLGKRLRERVEETETRLRGELKEMEEKATRERKELEDGKRTGVLREAEKWEKALGDAVEAGEKRRVEEVEKLKGEYEARGEEGRKKIADAAKKAIEEARRR